MNRATRTGLFVLPILLSLGLALPAAGSVYTDVVVADDPVAYWPLDETSTSSPALDLSSNHHNGVYGGSVTLGTASASASLGTAATFDTTDDEVNVTGVGTDYQFANNFTLEAWVKRRSTGTVGMILSTGDWYMGHYPSGTDDCFRFTTLGVRDYSFPTLFPYDTWTHVAAVMDGNNDVSLYFNGQFQTKLTHTLPGHTASSTLRIGAYVSGGSYDWQGEIDEVAVYGKALSSAQIANHYATGATGVKLPVADVAVYHLDEGTGGTAHDATWPQQHGTVHGATWTAGKWDSALTFDGVDDYVETTLTEAVALPLSVEAWVKTTDASGGIVNKYQSGSYNGFQVFMNAGHLGAWYLAGSSHTTRTDGNTDPDLVIGDGQWHHTVTVFDETGTTHYVDGELAVHVGWSVGGPADSWETTPLRLGTYPNSAGIPSVFFNGSLDEVAIYGRALSADEALARFLAGPPGAHVPEPSTFLLAALGLIGLALSSRRGRRSGTGVL